VRLVSGIVERITWQLNEEVYISNWRCFINFTRIRGKVWS
jgi:hypothetical protein